LEYGQFDRDSWSFPHIGKILQVSSLHGLYCKQVKHFLELLYPVLKKLQPAIKKKDTQYWAITLLFEVAAKKLP